MITPVTEQGRPAVVLVVDDNEDHVYLTRLAFGESRLLVELHEVDNGEKCMQFLRRQGPYADAPRPDFVLLDLHMPRMDGYEVLQAVLADPALRTLPVIVLSTSAESSDVERMHALRCSSYIVKPVDFDEFVGMTRQLAEYWLSLVVLPVARPSRPC